MISVCLFLLEFMNTLLRWCCWVPFLEFLVTGVIAAPNLATGIFCYVLCVKEMKDGEHCIYKAHESRMNAQYCLATFEPSMSATVNST